VRYTQEFSTYALAASDVTHESPTSTVIAVMFDQHSCDPRWTSVVCLVNDEWRTQTTVFGVASLIAGRRHAREITSHPKKLETDD